MIGDVSYRTEYTHLTSEEIARLVEVSPERGDPPFFVSPERKKQADEVPRFVLPGREGEEDRVIVQLYDEDQIPGFHEVVWSTRKAALRAYKERPLAEAGKSSS